MTEQWSRNRAIRSSDLTAHGWDWDDLPWEDFRYDEANHRRWEAEQAERVAKEANRQTETRTKCSACPGSGEYAGKSRGQNLYHCYRCGNNWYFDWQGVRRHLDRTDPSRPPSHDHRRHRDVGRQIDAQSHTKRVEAWARQTHAKVDLCPFCDARARLTDLFVWDTPAHRSGEIRTRWYCDRCRRLVYPVHTPREQRAPRCAECGGKTRLAPDGRWYCPPHGFCD